MDLSRVVWRKASRSKEDGSNCIELAKVSGIVAVRDSQDPNGPKLIFGHSEFRQFANMLKSL